MKIYCDTNTLPHNISAIDVKSRLELSSVKELAENFHLFGSHFVRYEVMNTKQEVQRGHLIVDYKALEPIPNDERLLGFNSQMDRLGTFISSPMISDVQDELLRGELMALGLKQKDAEHVTQAACNDCDVFLTRDKAIIKRRSQIEKRLPKLRVLLPSELLKCIQTTAGAIPMAPSI